jgi:hypothetical protein
MIFARAFIAGVVTVVIVLVGVMVYDIKKTLDEKPHATKACVTKPRLML